MSDVKDICVLQHLATASLRRQNSAVVAAYRAVCRAGQPWCNAGCRVDTASPVDAFSLLVHSSLDFLLLHHCSFFEPSDFLNKLLK